MDDDHTILTGPDVEGEALHDWRILFGTLHARFDTGDFATGARLVAAVADAADAVDHHPDVTLTYPRVDIRLTSHDVGGVTQRDVRLARTISALAADLGATPRPEQTQAIELALDTPDHTTVKAFWVALLGYRAHPERDDELNDPFGVLPTIWFQTTEPHDPPRQRWHIDVRIPPEVAGSRIAAALAAGGALVSDEYAPSFWVLADPDGNRACITTWLDRDQA